MVEIESCFFQLSISTIHCYCIKCNTLDIAPDLNSIFFVAASSLVCIYFFFFFFLGGQNLQIAWQNLVLLSFLYCLTLLFFFFFFIGFDFIAVNLETKWVVCYFWNVLNLLSIKLNFKSHRRSIYFLFASLILKWVWIIYTLRHMLIINFLKIFEKIVK